MPSNDRRGMDYIDTMRARRKIEDLIRGCEFVRSRPGRFFMDPEDLLPVLTELHELVKPGSGPSSVRHHDQTSSVTNGRNGANSRSSTDSAAVSAAFADPAPSAPCSPYRRPLTSSR